MSSAFSYAESGGYDPIWQPVRSPIDIHLAAGPTEPMPTLVGESPTVDLAHRFETG
jgi:hypothetical protein